MALPPTVVPQVSAPAVYGAVRAIGTLRPKFNPQAGRVFADELNVIGTGFWLKERKILVTCAHVVAPLVAAPIELAGLLVVGNAGQYKRAIIDIIDHRRDLAVLTLLGGNNLPLTGAELDQEASSGLMFVDSYPVVAEPVAYAGFPMGNQLLNAVHSPTYSEGVVGVSRKEGPSRKEIQITGPVAGGFSGSPVVLKNDPLKIVGLVSSGPSASPDGASNIFLAVSWEHIRAIAELARS